MKQHKSILISTSVGIVTLVILAIIVFSCQNLNSRSLMQQTTRYDGSHRVSLSLPALDDPHNPYREKYAEWDNWIYQNLIGVSEGADNAYVANRIDDTYLMLTLLDKNGYMIPHLEYVRQRELAIRSNNEASIAKSATHVYARGAMTPDMVEAIRDGAYQVKAQFYPLIPDWLAANPPQAAMLLPNGDIVTQGPLGSGADSSERLAVPPDPKKGCCGESAENGYYRYSSSGEPLGYSSGFWWLLYYDMEVLGMPEGELTQRRDGYFIFKDAISGEILSVYDYTGEELSPQMPPERDPHWFHLLKTNYIKRIHLAQHQLGLT